MSASTDFSYIDQLAKLLPDIPADSIVSRSVYRDETVQVTLFGFAAGQELSEHTAARPAILHFIAGEGTVTLGAAVKEAGPGSWVHMPAHLPHSIVAHTPLSMLLILLK